MSIIKEKAIKSNFLFLFFFLWVISSISISTLFERLSFCFWCWCCCFSWHSIYLLFIFGRYLYLWSAYIKVVSFLKVYRVEIKHDNDLRIEGKNHSAESKRFREEMWVSKQWNNGSNSTNKRTKKQKHVHFYSCCRAFHLDNK